MDNITGAWLPDIHYVYGDKLKELGLDDNRTIMHEQRFMLTNNVIDPKCYMVSKVVDLTPFGIIKMTFKQDDFDITRDNVELRVCDYYNREGKDKITDPTFEDNFNPVTTLDIKPMYIDNNYELDIVEDFEIPYQVTIGKEFYFSIETLEFDVNWTVALSDEYKDGLTDKEIMYFEQLIKINQQDNYIVSLKPSKANSLIGKHFILSALDENGTCYSSIELEVVTNG